jgi:hypothetical protein
MDILHLFCDIDDFCQFFEPQWKQLQLSSGEHKRNRESSLALSEVMTLIVLFHASSYRNFKSFYTDYVMKHMAADFPHLVSYNRFVASVEQCDGAAVCLPADTQGGMFRHLLHRFHFAEGLP